MDELNNNTKNLIIETIKKIVDFVDLECQVETKEEVDDRNNKSLLVSVYAPDNAKFLIGKNGQNLKSFEHILRAIFTKKDPSFGNIVLDINDYKKSKISYIAKMAREAVARVRGTQKSEVLMPMTAYERRIVHMELASYPDIATESIGEEPQRYIVVRPYP